MSTPEYRAAVSLRPMARRYRPHTVRLRKIDASTEGKNRDLRKALPVLAAAMIEFVGKDTQGQKTIKLKDDDPDGAVAFVKKGL